MRRLDEQLADGYSQYVQRLAAARPGADVEKIREQYEIHTARLLAEQEALERGEYWTVDPEEIRRLYPDLVHSDRTRIFVWLPPPVSSNGRKVAVVFPLARNEPRLAEAYRNRDRAWARRLEPAIRLFNSKPLAWRKQRYREWMAELLRLREEARKLAASGKRVVRRGESREAPPSDHPVFLYVPPGTVVDRQTMTLRLVPSLVAALGSTRARSDEPHEPGKDEHK